MTLALGIDIGTSGVRTAVVDADRQVLSMARAQHLPQHGDKIDANLWWDAVRTCLGNQIDALKSAGISPSDIRRISVDGTSGSMVLTDRDCTPVSPALMYNSKGFDAEAAVIGAVAPAGHITQGSNSALARAMRLRHCADGSPAHLLHQADFIAAKLMARPGFSDHNNALKTGFDPETERWPDWIDAVFDAQLLPDVKPVGTPLGPLSPQVADAFGLSRDAMVCAGTTDSIAAFLAAAPLDLGVAVTSLGSTLAVKVLSARRIDDTAIGLYSHKLGDHWLVGGASNTGGAVLAQFFDADQIAALSARMDASAPTGLDYYPLPRCGERFPINDPTLAPRMEPRPPDDVQFLQALFEGIAAIEARCYAEIAARGGGMPNTILTAGGGAQNAKWSEIRALRLGRVPQAADNTEAAIGSAFVATMVA
ncbi:MAG: FGGY-family carbohydrate kinase [Pseudomonadota bacterium]